MPGGDRVGGDEPGQIQERLSADSLAGDKDAVLFPKEVDRRLLVAIDPACECREEDLPGLKGVGHEPVAGMYGPRSQLPMPSGGQ